MAARIPEIVRWSALPVAIGSVYYGGHIVDRILGLIAGIWPRSPVLDDAVAAVVVALPVAYIMGVVHIYVHIRRPAAAGQPEAPRRFADLACAFEFGLIVALATLMFLVMGGSHSPRSPIAVVALPIIIYIMAVVLMYIYLRRTAAAPQPRSGSSPSRIYGPNDLEDTFLIEEAGDQLIGRVGAKIQNIYGKVEDPTNRNGFCFGLLDPVSNIVVTSVISAAIPATGSLAEAIPASGSPAGGGRDEGPDMQMAEGGKDEAPDMAMRSLNGLVSFLTCLFPYLPEEEALRYIDSARAHPIVACRLIIRRRGMCEFDFNTSSFNAMAAAIETALRCAAVAAQHPDPQQFVLRWKLLSLNLYKFPNQRTTQVVIREQGHTLVNIAGAPNDHSVIIMKESWLYAQDHCRNVRVKELPPARAAMKRMLLAIIHGLFLEALARLPTTELRSRYHHSMLMGGYCYGPLDPVSNIIINTIWYEQMFPLNKDTVSLQMISTKCLWRIIARSLYGLISFLCTRYHDLTPDLALQRLLVAKADLRAADPKFPPLDTREHLVSELDWSCCYQVGSGTTSAQVLQRRTVDSRTPSTSVEEAYTAAATAVFHPNPSAQKEVLVSGHVLLVASETLQSRQGDVLSTEDIMFLSRLLRRPPIGELEDEQVRPKRRKKAWYTFVSNCSGRFWDQHKRVCSKIQAVLDAFNEKQPKELKYCLHVICGVNELVSGPEFCTDAKSRGYNPWTPFKYHYSHINFLATCGQSKPTLFFAECCNHGTDKDWCIPVQTLSPLAEHVRCIYCEYEGNRIVHPAGKPFHGRDKEFEKVLRGEPLFTGADKDLYINNRIIIDKQEEIDWVHSVDDDYIYSVNNASDVSFDDDDDDDDLYIPFD